MNLQSSMNYLDLNHTIAKELFLKHTYPWEVLNEIKEFIISYGKTLSTDEYYLKGENIWIAKDAIVSPTAEINGPCIIGHNTEIRHCAYIRGNVIVGDNCVIGNSSELKNSILFDNAMAPHFNYVGDSVMGYFSHIGAGVKISNLKQDKSIIYINKHCTNLKKMGAIIGDRAEIGCNSVLNPGSIIGNDSNVYPMSCMRGTLDSYIILKNNGEIIKKH